MKVNFNNKMRHPAERVGDFFTVSFNREIADSKYHLEK